MAAVHQYYTVYLDDDDRHNDTWSGVPSGGIAVQTIVGCCLCGWRGQNRSDTAESGVQAFTEWWGEHYAPMIRPDPGEILMLSDDAGQRRHYLAGRPVQSGTTLDLLLSGEQWVPVRYEWSTRDDVAPRFYLQLGGPWETIEESGPETYLMLPLERTVFRWPQTGTSLELSTSAVSGQHVPAQIDWQTTTGDSGADVWSGQHGLYG